MKKLVGTVFVIASILLAGCGVKENKMDRKIVYETEAENGTMEGNAVSVLQKPGYSGEGYASGLTADGDSVSVVIEVSSDGFYDLGFFISAQGGYKENYVYVDGVSLGTLKSEKSSLEECMFERVFLSKGSHTVKLKKYWGYVNFDRLLVYESSELPKDLFKVSAKLSNPNASDNAKRVMSYLCDTYGKQILSGQYAEGGYGSFEVFQIMANNGGMAPAVIGLEMGHCNRTAITNDFTHPSVESAMDFWDRGGIVTMCYHWLAPEKYLTGIWWNGFRSEAVNIPLEKIMNGEDEEGMQLLLEDIDILAQELKALSDADVPVLWRPLHEAAGGWFWWGDHGAETYKKLYILMYEKLTNEYGLNNLIWVWNGQDKDWYPGDEYVDIIGTDIYPEEKMYASHVQSFLELRSWVDTNKMIVMSENGTMPDIDAAVRDKAMWGFFCTWEGEFVLNDGLKKSYSEQYTEKEMMAHIYGHEKVITLDELPDLKEYKIRNR